MWFIFSHPCGFMLSISFCLNAFREHMVGFCFIIQPGNLFLLIGWFSPFIFNVIVDVVGFVFTTWLFVFRLYFLVFLPLLVFYLLTFPPTSPQPPPGTAWSAGICFPTRDLTQALSSLKAWSVNHRTSRKFPVLGSLSFRRVPFLFPLFIS